MWVGGHIQGGASATLGEDQPACSERLWIWCRCAGSAVLFFCCCSPLISVWCWLDRAVTAWCRCLYLGQCVTHEITMFVLIPKIAFCQSKNHHLGNRKCHCRCCGSAAQCWGSTVYSVQRIARGHECSSIVGVHCKKAHILPQASLLHYSIHTLKHFSWAIVGYVVHFVFNKSLISQTILLKEYFTHNMITCLLVTRLLWTANHLK